jgi:hypothetical protein
MPPAFQHLSQKLESIPFRASRIYVVGSKKEQTMVEQDETWHKPRKENISVIGLPRERLGEAAELLASCSSRILTSSTCFRAIELAPMPSLACSQLAYATR